MEINEIRRLWPKSTLRQKQPAQRFGLCAIEDNRGYLRLAIDKKKKNIPALYNFNLLVEGMKMLKKIVEEFGLNEKLCFIDKTPISAADIKNIDRPLLYNVKVKQAMEALDRQLASFALIDKGIKKNERLCLLVERGSFGGMGYLPETALLDSVAELTLFLNPYADNDYIRNSIYSFAEANPGKKIDLNVKFKI